MKGFLNFYVIGEAGNAQHEAIVNIWLRLGVAVQFSTEHDLFVVPDAHPKGPVPALMDAQYDVHDLERAHGLIILAPHTRHAAFAVGLGQRLPAKPFVLCVPGMRVDPFVLTSGANTYASEQQLLDAVGTWIEEMKARLYDPGSVIRIRQLVHDELRALGCNNTPLTGTELQQLKVTWGIPDDFLSSDDASDAHTK